VTQNTQEVGAPAREPGGPAPLAWWMRPWVIPLGIAVISYLIYQLRPYVNLNQSTAPLPPHQGFSLYYDFLLVHISCATVAMSTVAFQLWPWLRRRHPRIHRTVGRIYVFTALPAAIAALVIVRFAPPAGKVGVTMATLLWMGTTTTGFVMARRKRYVEHRRFMLYSFAIVVNNFWGVVIVQAGLHAPFHIDLTYLLESARWVGWTVNLMIVQWWLYRTARLRREFARFPGPA
jgi:uncharacterized membrane protein